MRTAIGWAVLLYGPRGGKLHRGGAGCRVGGEWRVEVRLVSLGAVCVVCGRKLVSFSII